MFRARTSACPAQKIAGDYLKGERERQDYLETAIKWISDGKINEYMSQHRKDDDVQTLWDYFNAIITWVETTFIKKRAIMKGIDWGRLYRTHKNDKLDP